MSAATDRPLVEPASPSVVLPPAGLLTRRQAARYVNDTLGRPMSFSTATKLAALGEFAEPALWWGRRPLYRAEDLMRSAEGRSSHKRPPLKATLPAVRDAASSAAPKAPAGARTSEAAESSPAAKKRTGKAGRSRVEATAGA